MFIGSLISLWELVPKIKGDYFEQYHKGMFGLRPKKIGLITNKKSFT